MRGNDAIMFAGGRLIFITVVALLSAPMSSVLPVSMAFIPSSSTRRIAAVIRPIKTLQKSYAGPPPSRSEISYNHVKQEQQQSQQEADSLEAYERDVAIVLKDLRVGQTDPTIPRPFHRTSKRRLPSFTKTWTLEDWSRHTSRWRYWDYLRTFPSSRLLLRIFPHLALLVTWSIFVVWLCSRPAHTAAVLSGGSALNLTPLSLVSTFVFALETLRSNQGLSRLNEGRAVLGKVILYTRDMAQLVATAIYPKNQRLGLKLARHLALFSWLLKKHLRGEKVNGTDEDIIRTMLNQHDAAYVLQQRKASMSVVTRLRQVISHMAEEGQLSTAEEIAMDHTAQEMNHCITTAERIVSSPIPVLYTAHLGRLLIFYLLLLPLALRGSNILNPVATVLTTTAVGYAMLGLDEISHLLEQPFKYMPLYQMSKISTQDVADAFVCQPPSLEDSISSDSDKGSTPSYRYPPTYW
jgi:putative membrane protein